MTYKTVRISYAVHIKTIIPDSTDTGQAGPYAMMNPDNNTNKASQDRVS